MKLPRLSEPRVYRDGDLEITVASHFDLMSTRGQWLTVIFAIVPIILLSVFLIYKS